MKKPGRVVLESKADNKWCPHVRYPFEVATGIWLAINRKDANANPQWARCQSTECIYWERISYDREENDWTGQCGYGM
jgi:hypothetical protein